MRPYQCIAAEALLVSAAHSRVIAPGEVVDFDEVVRPRDGAPYSLETALGPADAAKFEAIKDWPALAAEAEAGLSEFFDAAEEEQAPLESTIESVSAVSEEPAVSSADDAA